jgi:transcription initiation factor TFIID subunit 2
MGSFLLLKLYQHFKQRQNDFSDMPEYFVFNAIFCSLGDLRNVPDAKMTLIDALQSNDNSRNAFDDSYRLAIIVSALGNCADDHHRRETNDIVDRLLTMDRLSPSYRNIVTQAGLFVSIFQDALIDLNESYPRRAETERSSAILVLYPRGVFDGCPRSGT